MNVFASVLKSTMKRGESIVVYMYIRTCSTGLSHNCYDKHV